MEPLRVPLGLVRVAGGGLGEQWVTTPEVVGDRVVWVAVGYWRVTHRGQYIWTRWRVGREFGWAAEYARLALLQRTFWTWRGPVGIQAEHLAYLGWLDDDSDWD
jgi:hypothetical protein